MRQLGPRAEKGRGLMRLGYVYVVSVILTITACSDTIVPVQPGFDGSPIQTDSLQYTLQHSPGTYEVSLNIRYTNRSRRPVYTQACTPNQREPFPFWSFVRADGDTTRLFAPIGFACN